MRLIRDFFPAVVFVSAALFVSAVWAAPPQLVTIEGAVASAGGGAAADGTYELTFNLYPSKTAKAISWSEGPAKVAVKGGRFTYALGSTKPVDPKLLASIKEAWLGVTIGKDPELPRRRLQSVPFALVAAQANALTCSGCVTAAQVANGGVSAAKVGFTYAASATKGGPASDLACSGCVSVKELKFDGDVNLGGNNLKAKNGTFTGTLAAASVTAAQFIGDGSKLTGIKIPSGSCKTGSVVAGINPDGSLKCVAGGGAANLPKDGLNEISNDLLSNQFQDTIQADKANVPIPDNQGVEAVSDLNFPNIGDAQTFDLAVNVANTDLGSLSLTVLPPNDKKTGWVLCDPCGKTDAKSLKTVYNLGNKPKSGDIGAFIGKNPKGLWNLKAKDVKFCVPQAPGNGTLCNPSKKTDGAIVGWSIKIQTLSNKKIALNAKISGNIDASGGLRVGKVSACNADNYGMLRWGGVEGLQACNGDRWVAAKPEPIVFRGNCSQSRDESSSWNYYCLKNIYERTAIDRGYITVSTKTPAGVTDGYDKEWQNDSQVGRITINVTGYYRITWSLRGQPYRYLSSRVTINGSDTSYLQQSGGSGYFDKSSTHNLVRKLTKGQYLNFLADTDTDNGSSYAFFSGNNGNVTVEYLGQTWK